jgi:hypothetical protein
VSRAIGDSGTAGRDGWLTNGQKPAKCAFRIRRGASVPCVPVERDSGTAGGTDGLRTGKSQQNACFGFGMRGLSTVSTPQWTSGQQTLAGGTDGRTWSWPVVALRRAPIGNIADVGSRAPAFVLCSRGYLAGRSIGGEGEPGFVPAGGIPGGAPGGGICADAVTVKARRAKVPRARMRMGVLPWETASVCARSKSGHSIQTGASSHNNAPPFQTLHANTRKMGCHSVDSSPWAMLDHSILRTDGSP